MATKKKLYFNDPKYDSLYQGGGQSKSDVPCSGVLIDDAYNKYSSTLQRIKNDSLVEILNTYLYFPTYAIQEWWNSSKTGDSIHHAGILGYRLSLSSITLIDASEYIVLKSMTISGYMNGLEFDIQWMADLPLSTSYAKLTKTTDSKDFAQFSSSTPIPVIKKVS